MFCYQSLLYMYYMNTIENFLASEYAPLCIGAGVLVIVFLGLLFAYYWRKNRYYHQLSQQNKPTHIVVQICMLACLLVLFLWVCGWCAVLSAEKMAWLAGVGVLLTWMFQDAIKNVVAYVTLYFNDMLHLGDWIKVEQYGIDGEVKDISLTSVIVQNWDNTRSTISTQSLLNANVQNLQNALKGDACGRRITHNFLIDVHSVRVLTPDELATLKQYFKSINKGDVYIMAIEEAEKEERGKTGMVFNTQLFRAYLRKWLSSQETIIRPNVEDSVIKLAIRLLDSTPEGLPMQIYAFTTSTEWTAYEMEKTRIVEHVVGTIEKFGLVLFQNPAGTDTNNVCLTKE